MRKHYDRITAICQCGYRARRSTRLVEAGLVACPGCHGTLKASGHAKVYGKKPRPRFRDPLRQRAYEDAKADHEAMMAREDLEGSAYRAGFTDSEPWRRSLSGYPYWAAGRDRMKEERDARD